MTIEKIACCYQVFRPSGDFRMKGVGRCSTCSVDDKNKYCKKYLPIRIFITDNDDTNRSEGNRRS